MNRAVATTIVVVVMVQLVCGISVKDYANALSPEDVLTMKSPSFVETMELTEQDFVQDMLAGQVLSAEELDTIKSSEAFADFRELRINHDFDMSVEEYDAKHEESRVALLSAAESLNVQVDTAVDTYEDVLARIKEAQAAAAAESSEEGVQSLVEVDMTSLESAKHLFANSPALDVSEVEDAKFKQLSAELEGAVTGLTNYLQSAGCSLCNSLSKQLNLTLNINRTEVNTTYNYQTLCENSARSVCSTVLRNAVPAFQRIENGVCSYPIRLEYQISEWCRTGIAALAAQNGTSDCFCSSVRPTLSIPSIRLWGIPLQQTRLFNQPACTPDATKCPLKIGY